MPSFKMVRKIISVGGDYVVEDPAGKTAYVVDGKVRFGTTFDIKDASGNVAASCREKVLSIDRLVDIERNGAHLATVKQVFLRDDNRKFAVSVEGGDELEARGHFYQDSYGIFRGEQRVAAVKEVTNTLRESYDIEISSGQDEVLLVAVIASIVKLVPPSR